MKTSFLAIVATSALLISASATASGTLTDGDTIDYDKYNFGKKVFYEKVNCSDCLIKNSTLSRSDIKKAVELIKQNGEVGQTLSERDRKAVVYYVKTRFGKYASGG